MSLEMGGGEISFFSHSISSSYYSCLNYWIKPNKILDKCNKWWHLWVISVMYPGNCHLYYQPQVNILYQVWREMTLQQ